MRISDWSSDVCSSDLPLSADLLMPIINAPDYRSRFVAAAGMPWQPTDFDGIEMKILYQDDAGRSTILFKLAPGAVVPSHEHTAQEMTYMLECTLVDDEGRSDERRIRKEVGRTVK